MSFLTGLLLLCAVGVLFSACSQVAPPPPGEEPAAPAQRLAQDYERSRIAKMARFCLGRVRIFQPKDVFIAERLAKEISKGEAWARRHGDKGLRMEQKGDTLRARLEYIMSLNHQPLRPGSLKRLAALLGNESGLPYRSSWSDTPRRLARRVYYNSDYAHLLSQLWGYGPRERIPEKTPLKLPHLDSQAPGVWARGERMMNIARTQMEAGRYLKALNLAKRAIRQRPRSKEIGWMLNTARYLTGLQYMRLKRFKLADEFLGTVDLRFFDTAPAQAEMRKRRLRLARVHNQRGNDFLAQGDYKRARRQFEMALDYNPHSQKARRGMQKARHLTQ